MESPPPTKSYMRYEDAIAGVGLVMFGALGLFISRNYPIGSASMMGPGYFPRLICWCIIGLGAIIALVNLRAPLQVPETPDTLRMRPLLLIALGYIGFGLSLRYVGLLPAALILILVSSFAVKGRTLRELLAVIVALEALTFAMWYLVRMPAPLFGGY